MQKIFSVMDNIMTEGGKKNENFNECEKRSFFWEKIGG